ncbi:MAG: hypothetical protein WBA12_00490 [Catalinimonas sp.]
MHRALFPPSRHLAYRFRVRLTYGGRQSSTLVRVRMDPRLEVSEETLPAQEAQGQQLMRYVKMATQAMDQLNEAAATIQTVNAQLKERDDEPAKALKERGKALLDTIKAHKELIAQKEDIQGIRRDPNVVSGKLETASSYLFFDLGNAPTPTQTEVLAQAEKSLQVPIERVNRFFANEWAAYRPLVGEEAAEVTPFETYERIE